MNDPVAGQSRANAAFHGVVDPEKLNPISRWMPKHIDAPSRDFRDWQAITSWATAIAQTLDQEVLALSASTAVA